MCEEYCEDDSCLAKPNGDGTWQCFICRRKFMPVPNEAPAPEPGHMFTKEESDAAIKHLFGQGSLVIEVSVDDSKGILIKHHENIFKDDKEK